MACLPNINELINIDFSLVNDEFNWLYNTTQPVSTENGQLKLIPESTQSQFTRSLGVLDPTNNRIQLIVNLDVFRPQNSSHSTFYAKFEVFNGSNLVDVYSLYLEDLVAGQRTEYNFDRIYKFEGLTGNISLKITVVEGYQNQIFLDYLKTYDSFYCDDNVRNYFVFEDLFDDIVASQSSAIQLLQWEVDGVETLTPAFFSENNAPGGNPVADWFLALANIDGSNRQADTVTPNSFNPFISEWGLDFDPGNYYDGKPTGTTSLSDYGTGILQIGIGKPAVLNGMLQDKKGAFFIDIDQTKNLKVVFNVLVNSTNSDVFNSPDIYRKYTILFNVATCTSQFYYNDVLDGDAYSNQNDNGFLQGITGVESLVETIGCNASFAYNGQSGEFEFVMDFGASTGQCGIQYNAFSVPDKFEIEWNGNIYSSGYVGLSSYDQQLLNLGVSPSEIKTGTPSTGIGNIIFDKTLASPSTATIRVTAPLQSTAWNIIGLCPGGLYGQPPSVSITSASPIIQSGVSTQFDITATDPDGTIASYTIQWGDGGYGYGSGAPPATMNHTFYLLGTKNITIQIIDSDGLMASYTYTINVIGGTVYNLTGVVQTSCGTPTMSGTLTVTSGQIVVTNAFSVSSGTPVSATLTIDGQNLGANQNHVLGVGSYPFSSDAVNCLSGSGINKIIINIP